MRDGDGVPECAGLTSVVEPDEYVTIARRCSLSMQEYELARNGKALSRG